MSEATVTGALLCGGPNSKLSGIPKALLKLGDETLIDRQIRVMREICSEIIVVTDNPKLLIDHLDPSVRLITDYFMDCGPVGGIHAALHLARHPLVWIAGSDMPFLSAELARRLIGSRTEKSEAVIPLLRNEPIPLHGVYGKNGAEKVAKMLAAGETSKEKFLGRFHWLGIETDAWSKEPEIGEFDFVIRGEADVARAGVLNYSY